MRIGVRRGTLCTAALGALAALSPATAVGAETVAPSPVAGHHASTQHHQAPVGTLCIIICLGGGGGGGGGGTSTPELPSGALVGIGLLPPLVAFGIVRRRRNR